MYSQGILSSLVLERVRVHWMSLLTAIFPKAGATNLLSCHYKFVHCGHATKLFFPVWIQRLIHVVVCTSISLIVMARQCYVIMINNTYQLINIWLLPALSSYCESCCTGYSYKKMKILFYLFWGQGLAIPVMEPGLCWSPSWLKCRGTSPYPVFMHKFS